MLSRKATTLLCFSTSASETAAVRSANRSFTESFSLNMASGGSCLTYNKWELGEKTGKQHCDVTRSKNTNLSNHLLDRFHKAVDLSVQFGTFQHHLIQFLQTWTVICSCNKKNFFLKSVDNINTSHLYKETELFQLVKADTQVYNCRCIIMCMV